MHDDIGIHEHQNVTDRLTSSGIPGQAGVPDRAIFDDDHLFRCGFRELDRGETASERWRVVRGRNDRREPHEEYDPVRELKGARPVAGVLRLLPGAWRHPGSKLTPGQALCPSRAMGRLIR